MSWWKKPRRSSAEGAGGEAARSADVEVLAGRLFAHVYRHEIASPGGNVPCWSYVSRGLAELGQPEIVFTLRRDTGGAGSGYPPDPVHLLATLYDLAADGRHVGGGDVTEFGDRLFLGHHLLYARAQSLEGVPVPRSALAALLVTADELHAVREFGATRVLSRMGQASTYYPYPPWSDVRRRGLSFVSTFEHSVLSNMSRAHCPDVHVTIAGDQIVVSPLRGVQPPWTDRLAPCAEGLPVALLTALDPAADGCFVWEPGQRGPEAITPPGSDGSRVCGCFVGLLPDQPGNRGLIVEDGVIMTLTARSWSAVRDALVEGRDLVIPADGAERSLALVWREREYVSPIDGRSCVSESGWDTYQPNTSATADDAVTITQIRLLITEDELAAQSSPPELAAFCREIARCVQLAGGDDVVELLVRMRCTPEGHDVDVASRGDAPQSLLRACFDAISQLAPLPVKDGEVSFEIELAVSPR